MRTMTIPDPKLRVAVDGYAEAIIGISIRERQISDIDKEVLGTEGRLIQRVTELLREVSARRGHILSRDFARTLTEAKWQSIVLGTAGVLIGLFAALLVVRRTVRPLANDCELDPRGGRRRAEHRDPGDRPRQRDRRHRPRRRSVPADAGRRRRGARGRGAGAGRTAAGRGKLSQAVRGLGGRHLRHDAGRCAAQRQSGAGADDGLRHAAGPDRRHRRHRRNHLRSTRSAGGIRAADAARRHGPRVRIPGSRARRHGALALRQRQRRAQRRRRDRSLRRNGARHHRPEARRRCDRRRPPPAADGDRHRARGHQRQGQAAAIRADEPLHGRHLRHRAAGRDRPHHAGADVALWRGQDRRERQAGAGRRQGTRLLRGGIQGFRRQHAAMAGQQAADPRCGRRDRKHRHRRARYRRAQGRRTRNAQGQGFRRSGVAQFAGNPEFADRGGKARRPRPAGGRRRPRGQQSRRHQPDGRLRAGAQDRDVHRRGRARRACGAPA